MEQEEAAVPSTSLIRDPWLILSLMFLIPPVGLVWMLYNLPALHNKFGKGILWFVGGAILGFLGLYFALGPLHEAIGQRRFNLAREHLDFYKAMQWLDWRGAKTDLDKLRLSLDRLDLANTLGQDAVEAAVLDEIVSATKSIAKTLSVQSYSLTSALELRLHDRPLPQSKVRPSQDLIAFRSRMESFLPWLMTSERVDDLRSLTELYLGAVVLHSRYERWQEVDFWLAASNLDSPDQNLTNRVGQWVEQAAGQSKFHLKAWYLKARRHESLAQTSEAVSAYLQVFSLDVFYLDVKQRLRTLVQDQAELLLVLELFYQAETARFRTQDYATAVNLNQKILEMPTVPGPLLLETLYNQGFIFRVQMKRYEEAVTVLKRILDLGYSQREEYALYHIAMAYLYLGEYSLSDRSFARLQHSYPASDKIGRVEVLRILIKVRQLLSGLWSGESK